MSERAFEDMTPTEREEWLRAAFEWENCDECGGDETAHVCVAGPFGLPFAYCVGENK